MQLRLRYAMADKHSDTADTAAFTAKYRHVLFRRARRAAVVAFFHISISLTPRLK